DPLPEALQDTRPRAEVLQEVSPAEPALDGGTSGDQPLSPGVVAEQSGGGAGSPEATEHHDPAPGAAGSASAEAPESEAVPEPPIQAFANRHRRVLGLLVAVICAVLAVAYVTVVPPTVTGTGFKAFLVRWTVPACWALIAGVALTWALSLRRQIINGLAYAAVAGWVVYLVARLV